MRVAWHPESNEFVKASDIEREYGERTAELADDFEQPPAACRVCGRDLFLIKGNPKRIAHFRHPPLVHCPTKEPAGKPYLSLRPKNPDPHAGARLRQIVIERWKELYHDLQELIPYFSPIEFRTLMRRATERRTWDYRGLEFADLAKTLVMLSDYAPWTGQPGRELWFRFWYESTIADIDQLWIRREASPILFRASFVAPPRGGRPEYEDVVAIKDNWKIPEHIPVLRRTEVEEIDRWFTRNRDQFPQI